MLIIQYVNRMFQTWGTCTQVWWQAVSQSNSDRVWATSKIVSSVLKLLVIHYHRKGLIKQRWFYLIKSIFYQQTLNLIQRWEWCQIQDLWLVSRHQFQALIGQDISVIDSLISRSAQTRGFHVPRWSVRRNWMPWHQEILKAAKLCLHASQMSGQGKMSKSELKLNLY